MLGSYSVFNELTMVLSISLKEIIERSKLRSIPIIIDAVSTDRFTKLQLNMAYFNSTEKVCQKNVTYEECKCMFNVSSYCKSTLMHK